ncbi:MAG: pseudouridine synthase [Pseudomonadota bacterium]
MAKRPSAGRPRKAPTTTATNNKRQRPRRGQRGTAQEQADAPRNKRGPQNKAKSGLKRTPQVASTRASGAGAANRRRRPARPEPTGGPVEPMRIAKAMARAGLCSRRDAERWIGEGRVVVNGKTLETPAIEVGPKDRILVDGAPLPAAAAPRLWRYHKPRGQVTSHRDPEGRPTVFDNLPKHLPRVISIGRLDFNTEGLLLLTTDGDLARHLELPATGWLRRYRVRAFGSVTQEQLDQIADGVEIDGMAYGPIEATLDSISGQNVWLTVGLREGKNREVRRVLESLALQVNRLIRISYGPFQLSDLKPGDAESVKRRVLAEQLGPQLAERFRIRPEDDDEAIATPAKKPKRPMRKAARGESAAPRNSANARARHPRPQPSRGANARQKPRAKS